MALQTIDLERFLSFPKTAQVLPVEAMRDCVAVRDDLEGKSVCIVRDPRVDPRFMEEVQGLVVAYFAQPEGAKRADERAELGHQVGWTPAHTETARSNEQLLDQIAMGHKPTLLSSGAADPKERFFSRVGSRPPRTRYSSLNASNVQPQAFPQWEAVTQAWGQWILDGITTTLEMAAIGCGLPRDTFTRFMQHAPHLFAPTGSDLARFGEFGTVLAAWHYDLNLMTGHGPSNFPGLSGWTRRWERFAVEVPSGCLLMQVAKQLEWLTGGLFTAGFHQVVVSLEVIEAIERAKAQGKSLWRCGNTLFGHGASDLTLRVLPPFRTDSVTERYPTTTFGKQVIDEIRVLNLKKD